VRIWHELIEEGNDPAPVAAHVIPGLDPHTAHNLAVAVNTKRRNMTPPQKRELVAEELRYLARHYEEHGDKEKQPCSWSNSRLKQHCAVGEALVRDVRRKLEEEGEIPKAKYVETSDGRIQPLEVMRARGHGSQLIKDKSEGVHRAMDTSEKEAPGQTTGTDEESETEELEAGASG